MVKKERDLVVRALSLSLHAKITTGLASSTADEVRDQYNYYQTCQCTTHRYGDDVGRLKCTILG